MLLERVNLLMKLLLLLLGLDHDRRRLFDGLLDLLSVRRVLLEDEVEFVDLLLRNVDVESAQFVAQFLVALGLADLTLQRADLALHLAKDVRLT